MGQPPCRRQRGDPRRRTIGPATSHICRPWRSRCATAHESSCVRRVARAVLPAAAAPQTCPGCFRESGMVVPDSAEETPANPRIRALRISWSSTPHRGSHPHPTAKRPIGRRLSPRRSGARGPIIGTIEGPRQDTRHTRCRGRTGRRRTMMQSSAVPPEIPSDSGDASDFTRRCVKSTENSGGVAHHPHGDCQSRCQARNLDPRHTTHHQAHQPKVFAPQTQKLMSRTYTSVDARSSSSSRRTRSSSCPSVDVPISMKRWRMSFTSVGSPNWPGCP